MPRPMLTPDMTAPSPLLSLPRAIAASGVDAGVAAHYGDPSAEQRRLAAGEATVDLSHRGVVRVAGPDRLGWLHSLTTQHVADLSVDTPTEGLVLSPQGRVEHHFRMRDDGEAAWLTVEPGTAPALVEFLDRMRFLMRVQVEDVTDSFACLWSASGEALVDRETLAPDTTASWSGVWAYEALRIARGEPRLGLDTDHRTVPNEVGWLGSAVHMDKGCYPGQETVARVHTMGRVPRRLTRLHLDGSVDILPQHGDPVVVRADPERVVGSVGSAARHYEDGPLGLALLKRNVDVTAELLVQTAEGDVAAAQEVLVSPDVGLHFRP